jgi:hypothetical protein
MPLSNAAPPLTDWKAAPSPFQKVNFFLAQYRVLVYMLFGAALWVGAQFISPNQRISAVEKEQKAMRATLDELSENSKAVVRLQCFNRSYKMEELRLAGINCDAVNRGDFNNTQR